MRVRANEMEKKVDEVRSLGGRAVFFFSAGTRAHGRTPLVVFANSKRNVKNLFFFAN